MAKHVGDKGGIAAWRKAHDAMGKQLEAAEKADADDEGNVEVDYAACREGYAAMAGMFARPSSAADSASGMAMDGRTRAQRLHAANCPEVEELFTAQAAAGEARR